MRDDNNKSMNWLSMAELSQTVTTPSKVILLSSEGQGLISSLFFVIVLLLHLTLGSRWLNLSKAPVNPVKPVIMVEVALLTAPKPPVVVPDAPKVKASKLTPTPPKPTLKPAPPKVKKVLPILKPVVPVKTVLKSEAVAAIKLPEATASPAAPKTEPAPATVVNVSAPSKIPDHAVPTAKVDESITCISCPKPNYPAVARRRFWQGNVELRLQIGRDGSVVQVTLLNSSGYNTLDEAAIDGVKQWRFVASSSGVTRSATQSINFNLEQ